jgi:hypothetical protein
MELIRRWSDLLFKGVYPPPGMKAPPPWRASGRIVVYQDGTFILDGFQNARDYLARHRTVGAGETHDVVAALAERLGLTVEPGGLEIRGSLR